MQTMPNLNIHWKGYPNNRFPRIRVVSSRAPTIRSRRSISRSAERYLPAQTPFSLAVGKERRKYKAALGFRRRKGRSSKSSASAVRARRLASLRPKQDTHVFGWCTPATELASLATAANTISEYTSRKEVEKRPRQVVAVVDSTAWSTEIYSTDGAGSSSLNRTPLPKEKSIQSLYSLKNGAEVPVYWTKKPLARSRASLDSDRLTIYSTRTPGAAEYAHIRRLESISKRPTGRLSRPVGAVSTYATRTASYESGLKDHIGPGTHRSRVTTFCPTLATSEISPKKKQKKDPSFGDPAFRKSVNEIAQPKQAAGSVTPSIKSVVPSVFSDIPSRSASQRKVIDRFTKELDLYLQAAKSLPKQTILSSVSSTNISIDTVTPLQPYRSEFHSAGLAVTSADQKRIAELQEPPSPPPTPPKDEKWLRTSTPRQSKADMAPVSEKKLSKATPSKTGKQLSFASGSTGTDVIGFTPPHEKSYPWGAIHRKESSSEASHTMAWTPQQEKMISPPQKEMISGKMSSGPRPPTKKSLPWLRRADASPGTSPTSRKKSAWGAAPQEPRTSTPLQGWVDSHKTKDIPFPQEFIKRSEVVPPRGSVPYRQSEVRFEDTRTTRKKASATEKRAEATTQTSSYPTEAVKSTQSSIIYASTAVQIDMTEPIDNLTETLDDHPPIPTGRNMTFPLKSSKCTGDCHRPPPKKLVTPVTTSKPSKVAWRGNENCTQTDPVDALNPQAPHSRELSFTPIPKPTDRTLTFPITAGTGRAAGPFRPTAVLRRPNKDLEGPPIVESENAEELYGDPPSRRSPSPPSCTQCSCEGKTTIPELKSEVGGRVGQDITKPQRGHTCAASSFECQQCSMPEPSPVVVSSPEPIMQLPEERNVQRRIVRETIEEYAQKSPVADPSKKLSAPRLKLRSVPAPQPLSSSSSQPSSTLKTSPRLPQQPVISDTSPIPVPPSISTFGTVATGRYSDKQVFKGLHVATAAACDEDVDKWIEEITGCGVRKFLADLSAFHGLGVNTLADVAKRAAKQRRQRIRGWEHVREQKLLDMEEGGDRRMCVRELELELVRGAGEVEEEWEDVEEGPDGRLGFVAKDRGDNLRGRECV